MHETIAKESDVELNLGAIDAVERATDLLAIPIDNAAHQRLEEIFGDHTYFLNDDGLYVFEAEIFDGASLNVEAHLYAYAIWAEDEDDKLVVLEDPAPAGVVLDLENDRLDKAAASAPTIH